MAITLVTNSVDGAGYVANGYSADWSGCEQLVAAVTGKSIYVERIAVSALAAEIITIGAGETGGAVTAVVVGPIHVAAGTGTQIDFSRPIKLETATALTADAAGGGAATIVVQGYVR